MPLPLVLPFLAAILIPATQSRVVSAKVPAQAIEFQIALPSFEAEAGTNDSERVILRGSLGSEIVISVMCDENFPFLSGADCRKRYAASPGYEAIQVGDLAACKLAEDFKGLVKMSHYYGWLATPDHLFTVHLSRTGSAKAKPNSFRDADFSKLLKSMRTRGQADRTKYRYPPEVYAFRDEAAAHSPEQLEWVREEAQKRPDDFAVQFYLGALASQFEMPDVFGPSYGRAAELLLRRDERDAKQTHALFVALDNQSYAFAMREQYQEALVSSRRLVALSEKSDHPKAPSFRHNALLNAAICEAQTAQAAAAIVTLRQLIGLAPDFKERVANHVLLKPLHGREDFQKLVGS